MTTRRNVLASIAGLVALGAPRALAQGAAIGDIRVDITPLRAGGWGGAPLAIIDRNLRAGLQQAFADRLGQGGPLLVVRIDAVNLSSYAGGIAGRSGWGSNGGGGMTDYMDGELVLVGRGNTILSRTPLLNAFPSEHSGGNWAVEGNELRRLAALSTAYARWARWKLG